MHLFIAIQSTPYAFEIALFKGNNLIDKISEDKRHTSKLFIPMLEVLLSKNAVVLSDLSFCAVNCGPAPFSTLRSIIASVNGLHCAIGIPLVSIDGLEATFLEFHDTKYENTMVLLNAFNNESYYLLAQQNITHHTSAKEMKISDQNYTIISTGYNKTDLLLKDIQEQFSLNNIIIIDNKICSIKTIGKMGYEKYLANEAISGYLVPLHLKKHPVEQ